MLILTIKLIKKNFVNIINLVTCLNNNVGPIRKFIIDGYKKDYIVEEIFKFNDLEGKVGMSFFDYYIFNKIISIQ